MLIILFVISQWMTFLNSSHVYDMASCGDKLLIGTAGGALIFNKTDTGFGHITNVDGLLSNDVRQVEIDRYGNWWFLCTGGGITLMSGDRTRRRRFTYMEGLPSYNFSSLFIDGDTVWAGTDDEQKVWRYNMNGDPFNAGSDLPLLDIKPTNQVNVIAIIGDSMWFGTTKGIGVTRKGESSFIVYDRSNGLPNDTVFSIAEWGGYIWAGTRKGVARRSSSGWEVVDSSYWCPSPSCTVWIQGNNFCSSGSSFWSATSFGVKKWEGGNWSQISFIDARAVLFDSELWIGTFGNGIAKYDGDLHYYIPSGPPSNSFYSLTVDLDGNVWSVHGWDKSVSKLWDDGSAYKWKIYNKEEWAKTARPNNIMCDKKNNIWVPMWGYFDPLYHPDTIGVVKIMPNDSILKFNLEGGTNVNCIPSACIDDDNSLWLACYDKAIRRIRNDVVDTIISHEYITNWVMALAVDSDGNLWVGDRENGLVIFLRVGGTSRVPDFPMDEIKFINRGASAREIWVGTLTKGVYKIKDREIVLSYTSDEMGGTVNDMTIDVKGNIWFAVSGVGIQKLEPNGRFTTYDKCDGLVSDEVTKIKSYQDILWIGTMYGLSQFNTGSLSPPLTQVKVYPNPFILSKGHTHVSFDSKELEGSNIRIYTLSGRLVKSIEGIKASFASWDGRNREGEFVGSGIYIFVVVTQNGAKKIGKIAVVR